MQETEFPALFNICCFSNDPNISLHTQIQHVHIIEFTEQISAVVCHSSICKVNSTHYFRFIWQPKV